jgi:hypothetical protein
LQTRASGEYRFNAGELQASKKAPAHRGLNVNHNHDLKNLFKGVALHVSTSTDPLANFYRDLLAKGMKPSLARLTLARKMAAIVRDTIRGAVSNVFTRRAMASLSIQ